MLAYPLEDFRESTDQRGIYVVIYGEGTPFTLFPFLLTPKFSLQRTIRFHDVFPTFEALQ